MSKKSISLELIRVLEDVTHRLIDLLEGSATSESEEYPDIVAGFIDDSGEWHPDLEAPEKGDPDYAEDEDE